MRQIHPDDSLLNLLRRIVAGDVRVKIYSNDLTPDRDTVLADFTEMGVGSGYAPIDVPAADFVLSGVSAHKGTLMANSILFVPIAAGGNVYGYYYTNLAGDELLGCARFDAAPITWDVGPGIPVWPRFGDDSEFAS